MLWKQEGGQDLIEYVLLVAMIALLVAVAFPAVADAITSQLKHVRKCVGAPAAEHCGG